MLTKVAGHTGAAPAHGGGESPSAQTDTNEIAYKQKWGTQDSCFNWISCCVCGEARVPKAAGRSERLQSESQLYGRVQGGRDDHVLCDWSVQRSDHVDDVSGRVHLAAASARRRRLSERLHVPSQHVNWSLLRRSRTTLWQIVFENTYFTFFQISKNVTLYFFEMTCQKVVTCL